MDEAREIDIDLRKVFYMMKSKIVFILIITVVFGLSAAMYTHFFIDPTYSTSISLCVYNSPDKVSTDQPISQNEISAAQQLVGTYIFAIKSDTVLDKVAQDLNLGSAGSIRGSITTKQEEGTFAFRVTVSGKDPQRCVDIANAIAKIAPDEMVKVVKAGGVSVIDTAKMPGAPSAPDKKKNTLIGLAVGFVLSFVGFFIYELFDTTITNAKDLEREFELPVLGTVPMLTAIHREEDGEPDENEDSTADAAIGKPSNALLENLQSMKGEGKHDKK